MRVAFDMSSVIWTCLSAGKDVDAITVPWEGRMLTLNSAVYGYENAMNSMIAAMRAGHAHPKDLLLVFEGSDTKAPRIAIDPGYKKGRGNHPPEAYDAFNEIKLRLMAQWGGLGACAITQDGVEGDDVLGYLAANAEQDLMIVSGDGDIAVLAGPNAYGATIYVYNKGVIDANPFGQWSNKYITVYKALVGDVKDNIKGIPGFGEKAFDAFYKQFGDDGLAEMLRLGELGSLDELVPEMHDPMVKRLVDGRADYLRSFQLAKIHPEWVDTLWEPLKFTPGLIKGVPEDARLAEYAAGSYLVTGKKWDEFVEWFMPLMAESPWIALDIETSTPDESDEWLAAQDDAKGVDVIGSELTGMSLTFGNNLQHTVYIPVDHAETDNVDKTKLRDLVKVVQDAKKQLIIHNFSFEGTVLYHEWGAAWKDNGYEGYLCDALDTKMEASYVDENNKLGLKSLSKQWFNYDQVDYATVTTIDGVPHKMRELSGRHVKDYGCDDTICTASFHNFAQMFMEFEHTWKVYKQVEISAMYAHTQSFVHGFRCDVAKSKELEAIDDETYKQASEVLHGYLVSQGWAGSVCPTYTPEITPAQVKEGFELVTGNKLESMNRKMDKLVADCRAAGSELFAEALAACVAGDASMLNRLVGSHFTANPDFNSGSPLQMQKLLYEVMGLPVRVYNKPTPIMRKAGKRQGTPKSDELAIAYAKMMDATPEQKEVLEALRLMKMVETRRGLYYSTYPYFVHWKTGRIHSSHNQCSTNTRRASSSKPNIQQMPKHPKIEGQVVRFREVMVPHKRRAVIVSMDFASQELRVIADYSQDPNMLACFVGDNLRDMHALTGLGIAMRKNDTVQWDYTVFSDILGDKSHHLHKFVKECRSLGKKTNFTTEYGAMAPKLAMTLLVSEEEAQSYIDAREDTFPVVKEWKLSVIADARTTGYVTTKLGARRHLGPAFTSGDNMAASKAERQAVNTKIQGSSGEMTKLAEGRMWDERLEQRFDCQIIGPIHDEVVASCAIEDLAGFLPAMHACMVAAYADMQVPIESSISFGPNFGVQYEVGNVADEAAVESGLCQWAEADLPRICTNYSEIELEEYSRLSGIRLNLVQRALETIREKQKKAQNV